jgi:exodeoxyribonuclease VII large subunit
MAQTLSVLNALSPLAVLERGYAIGFIENKVVKSIDDVTIGDKFRLRLTNGYLSAQVLGKEHEHE